MKLCVRVFVGGAGVSLAREVSVERPLCCSCQLGVGYFYF